MEIFNLIANSKVGPTQWFELQTNFVWDALILGFTV